MTCGVYAIKNTVSGRVYIGSSVDIERRWAVHRHHLCAGTHHSRVLQSSWRKHGEKAFAFEVLVVLPENALIEYEQHFIERLKPSFNIHPNARTPLGVKRSDATRLKLSLLSQKATADALGKKGGLIRRKPGPRFHKQKRAGQI